MTDPAPVAIRPAGPAGFVHLHDTTDLSGRLRAHLGDVAVAEHADGTGVGRAIGIYERAGFVADTVSMSKPLDGGPP